MALFTRKVLSHTWVILISIAQSPTQIVYWVNNSQFIFYKVYIMVLDFNLIKTSQDIASA